MIDVLQQFREQLVCHLVRVKESVFPVYPPGIRLALLTSIPFFMVMPLGWYGFSLLCACLPLGIILFFRNPKRYPPTQNQDQLVVSPADGIISTIDIREVPDHLGFPKGHRMRFISIFMRVCDVHVNRMPASGRVIASHYKEGSFFCGYDGEAGVKNEAKSHRLRTRCNEDIVFVQIAGFIARRVHSELRDGDEREIGEVFGMIRFGSKMEVYLPETWSLDHLVLNQSVIAGETVLAGKQI